MLKNLFPSITEEEKKLPFYMRTVGYHKHQGPTHRPQGNQDYHWIHCQKGKGILLVEGKEYILDKNSGFFSYPNIKHDYYPIEEPWETYWLTFNGYALDPLLQQLEFGKIGVFSSINLDTINQLLSSISSSYIFENYNSKLNCSILVYKFVCELRNCMNQDSKINQNVILLAPVIEFIKSNYNHSLSIDEMSQIANITPQHLCRLFKQTYNTRPFIYLNRYRINRAKEMMHESPVLSINDIASSVGFNNAGYFCTVFKRLEGITPLEFKNMYNDQFDKYDLYSSKT